MDRWDKVKGGESCKQRVGEVQRGRSGDSEV